MCGICGFTGNRLKNREDILTAMMNRIIHRGPDGAGKYIDDGMNMGHRRLSIIDLDNGRQPMTNEDGSLIITFNGEIYNYKEIKEDLVKCGHTFANKSDTEVLIHGYEEYGPKLLDRLRGMFTFVLWDKNKKKVFAARDMFGIKPFYYTVVDGELVYGSEIKSILEYPGVKREVNLNALEQYLSFQYSVLPETFFKGIYKLMPGHYMTFENGNMEIERYFDPMLTPSEKPVDHAKLVDEIDDAVKKSINYHMVSDVEVASLLSSGVDSSYVASNFHGAKTFTVGFDYEKYNEIPYAKELSKKIGIENYSKIISTEEYWHELPRIQYFMDEPLADPSAIALYFVDREASKQVKVVLSGEGADELFGGYNIYHEPMSLAGYQKLPKGLRKALAAGAEKIPGRVKGKNFLIRGSKTVEERFIGNANIFTVKQRNKVLKYKTAKSDPKYLTAPYYAKVKDLDDVAKMQYIDLNFWLIGDILLKADKMSMAHSLESRVPFLDRGVYEVAKDIPVNEKVTDTNTKVAFREAAHRYLTSAGAEKKKLGFPVPIRIWLKQDKYYNIVKEAFTSEAAKKFFNTDELVKLLDDHRAGKMDYSRHIWNVYMFLLWYKEYFVEGGCDVSIEDELAMEREKTA
ncbi:MAG: asparagine synthase (glutamine-hydrolyzing) [Catonella sp.]|jgi:asparagine synthase (glutamine-hydrolysing)|nr:asparagine synthase (glutamine-hydrolyzing) [Catonella sp.]MDY6357345.1 asparagine synthase (glutamine-hydrolyzing) [Catonella sp.]